MPGPSPQGPGTSASAHHPRRLGPAGLAATRAWTHDQGWRDWPVVMGQYVQPPARDVARVSHLRGVAVPVREMNTLLTPMVRQLEPA